MTTFFLLMSLNPQAQRRAQAEIERVVGTDRLPTVDDQKDLPYTMALIKEVLRWSPVVPLGIVVCSFSQYCYAQPDAGTCRSVPSCH